jgi:hypothetical protein
MASIGNHRCSGLYLLAALELFAKKGTKEVLLLLGDSLQAHNLKTGPDPSTEDWQEAKRLGDDWLYQNQWVIDRSPVPLRLIRFHSLSHHDPVHQAGVKQLHRKLEIDLEFRDVMEDSVKQFQSRNGDFNRSHCVGFICEELPLFHRLATETFLGSQVHGICYPGSLPSVFKFVVNRANQHTSDRSDPFRLCIIEFDLTEQVLCEKAGLESKNDLPV